MILARAAAHSIGLAIIVLAIVLTLRLFAMENTTTGYRDSYRLVYAYYAVIGAIGVFCWSFIP